MKYEAIIFDMDGTIISTEHIWQEATHNILTEYLNHLSDKEHQEIKCHLKGMGLYESCKLIANKSLQDIAPEAIIEKKATYAHDIFSKGISFIPKFEDFHNQVLEVGLKTAIGTNATQETVEHTMTIVPLNKFFKEHIYHIDHVGKVCKPNPDVFLHAAKQLNVDPKKCIVIEDSAHGVKAAKAAGMFCIGINTGKDKHTLQEADKIVDCYSEIELNKILY